MDRITDAETRSNTFTTYVTLLMQSEKQPGHRSGGGEAPEIRSFFSTYTEKLLEEIDTSRLAKIIAMKNMPWLEQFLKLYTSHPEHFDTFHNTACTLGSTSLKEKLKPAQAELERIMSEDDGFLFLMPVNQVAD